jgi:hypothetical protein
LKKDLERIEQAGVAVGWTSLPDTQDLRLPTMDLLEAVRLYESAKEGFGKFPDQISKLLMATGLVWICVHPARRNIPDFWKAYYQAHVLDIDYTSSMDEMTGRQLLLCKRAFFWLQR